MSMPSQQGKTVVITGANSGIGQVTAREFARAGARVIIACRSRDKAEAAAADIATAAAGVAPEVLILDLGDLVQVREAAGELQSRVDSIDILINNAGVAGQRGETADGFELAFGINHVGHFLWTNLLQKQLEAGGGARIVNVSSRAHFDAKGVDFEALTRPTRGVAALQEYAVSKLANVLHASELAKRTAGTGITTYSLHPGVVATDVWRQIPGPIAGVIKLFMLSPDKGAATTLYCATSPECAFESGQYYTKSKRKEPSKLAKDDALAKELWRRSVQWTDSDWA